MTLLGAIAMGQAFGVWDVLAAWGDAGVADAKPQPNVARTVLFGLMALLAFASLWRASGFQAPQYRGRARWCGPWEDPNTCGVLMALGTTLACGMAAPNRIRLPSRGGEMPLHLTKALPIAVAAVCTGIALTRTYSRGGWLGAAVGLVWAGCFVRSPRERSAVVGWLRRNRAPVWLILGAGSISFFWAFQGSGRPLVRRALSITDTKDASWRNRVAAWEGGLQLVAEGTPIGLRSSEAERAYDGFYRGARVQESAAFGTNSYFVLGTMLGVPALGCFALYVGRCLRPSCKAQNLDPKSNALQSWRALCRAGTIVLLIGFWFDGVMFEMSTAGPFWVLLELGREDLRPATEESA